MKFVVIDDSKNFRDTIIHFIEEVLLHEVIGIANDEVAYQDIRNIHESDIIIMDIEMPNLNAIDTVKRALWLYPNLKFIAVTSDKEKAYLFDLIGAGFRSCVFKTSNLYVNLKQAIDRVINNEFHFPKEIKIENN